jgi:hypothetical protein
MTKKLFERSKMTKKSTLNKTKKNNTKKKMEPGTGGENPRSGRSQGALKTRSREGELAGVLYNIKKIKRTGNGTSSASVAMCEAFFDTCEAYLHE